MGSADLIIPPQNLEAEKSLLGSLLLDKDAMTKAADILRSDDFYEERHQTIFEAMTSLYNRQRPIDVVTVTAALKDRERLEAIGGASYLAELAGTLPSSANVVRYAEIVSNKATLRRLIAAANDISILSRDQSSEVDAVLDKAEQTLFAVSQRYLKSGFISVKEALGAAFERIDKLHEHRGELRGIPSGYRSLDHLLAGFQKSDLVVVASRPSIGKTSLVLNFSLNAALAGFSVGMFHLEMSAQQITERLISAQSGIDSWRLRTGNLREEDFARINDAMSTLSELAIYIDDSPSSNVLEMRTKARRLQMEKGLDMLVIDYLQLMEGRTRSENRVQEISEISRSLKGLARELDIPVIAVSQLSRAVEQRPKKIPQLADLRESGSIEQDADVVIFIYREDYYEKDSERPNVADIIIAKHRNGPTGQLELYFQPETMVFRSLETGRTGETQPLAIEETAQTV